MTNVSEHCYTTYFFFQRCREKSAQPLDAPDEIWSYLQKKKRQLWLFIILEAQTKFWVNFELGSRTSHTAHRLLQNLVALMPWGFEHFLLVTTDKLAAYEKAIANYFGKVRYAYLQIVKQRRKRRLVTVKQRVVKGKASDFGNKTKNTSYIERFNLTLRPYSLLSTA